MHIAGARLLSRPRGQSFTLKVYSNAKSLSLYRNGKLVSRKHSSDEPTGVIWTFPSLSLSSAQDSFRVVAGDGTEDMVLIKRGE